MRGWSHHAKLFAVLAALLVAGKVWDAATISGRWSSELSIAAWQVALCWLAYKAVDAWRGGNRRQAGLFIAAVLALVLLPALAVMVVLHT